MGAQLRLVGSGKHSHSKAQEVQLLRLRPVWGAIACHYSCISVLVWEFFLLAAVCLLCECVVFLSCGSCPQPRPALLGKHAHACTHRRARAQRRLPGRPGPPGLLPRLLAFPFAIRRRRRSHSLPLSDITLLPLRQFGVQFLRHSIYIYIYIYISQHIYISACRSSHIYSQPQTLRYPTESHTRTQGFV